MNKKKIIFFVNSLKFFLSHRINLAKTAFDNNFEVIIVASMDIDQIPDNFKNYNFINLNIRGSGFNFINEIKNIYKINQIINRYKPEISHFITIKSIFYASILSKKFNTKNIVISFTGIGSISSDRSLKTIIFKFFFSFFIEKLLNKEKLKIIFQNKDDQNFINNIYKFKKVNSFLIKGSGVDLNIYNYKKLKNKEKINFLFASRLLVDKGIKEFISASNKILNDGYEVTFTIVGDVDKLNPSFININVINSWVNNINKFFHGYQKNIIKSLEYSDIVVLPSYREGFPKILIEASAVGRPIISTNVPGCRECVVNNLNGYLVEPKSNFSLYLGMKKILSNLDNLEKMSLESRKIAENNYSIEKVNKKHLEIYKSFF